MRSRILLRSVALIWFGGLVAGLPLLDNPLLRSEDFDSSTDTFDDGEITDSSDEAPFPNPSPGPEDDTPQQDENPDSVEGHPIFLQIIDDLKETAKKIEDEDLADVDVPEVSPKFLEEEELASLMKAVHWMIVRSQSHPVSAIIEQKVASEIKQVEEDIELQQSGKGDAKAEQEIADEIHRVEDDMISATSSQAQQGAEEEIADAVKNIGAHIDEVNHGPGNPIEEKEIAREVEDVKDALQTSLTGKGNLAAETQIAGQIKRIIGTSTESAETSSSEEEAEDESSEEKTTEEVPQESAIGGLIHKVAGLFSGGGTATAGTGRNDEEKGTQPTTGENPQDGEETNDDGNSFYDDAFVPEDSSRARPKTNNKPSSTPSTENTSSNDLTKPSNSEINTDPFNSLDEDSYDDYHPDEAPNSSSDSKLTAPDSDRSHGGTTAGGKMWHMTALTVIMCAIVGMVMLVVVGVWYRRMSFRGGLPAAGHLVIEDDEDAVYTATTQPSEPPLGRYTKLQ